MDIRPIRNSNDHEQALARLTELLVSDPVPDSDEAAELQVLGTLVDRYEAEQFPIESPTPVEAIRFRMDQLGMTNKDLMPYVGSASRVSELLNGKRPLSLSMIRNLHRYLGIPAEVLIAEAGEADAPLTGLDASKFPAREMYQRGYFSTAPGTWKAAKRKLDSLLARLFHDAGVREASPAYLRSTAHYRQGKSIEKAALMAWQSQVLIRSRQRRTGDYESGTVDTAFLEKIADLSVFDDGPRLARERIEKAGIAVVIERHLPGTFLDGASFLRDDGKPVVGLTLRYDRLDNFWFTLLHELVHVGWHLNEERNAIFDDMKAAATDACEHEADDFTAGALIPEYEWRRAWIANHPTAEAVLSLAQTLGRHPSIIVGRLQHDSGNFRLLAKSPGVGRRQVRKHFAEFAGWAQA